MEWITGFQRWLSEDESLHNAQLVANHFLTKGWTKNSICALCGNMRHESSINPDMYEYGYEWIDNRGYGLVQWTPRTKYTDWAIANGYAYENGDSQLARIDYEADQNIQWIADGHRVRYNKESKYNFSFAEFRANTTLTIDQLTEAFLWNYEGPNYTKGLESLPDRQAFARQVSTQIAFDGGVILPETGKHKPDTVIHLWLSGTIHL
jgi:hypothetical protein